MEQVGNIVCHEHTTQTFGCLWLLCDLAPYMCRQGSLSDFLDATGSGSLAGPPPGIPSYIGIDSIFHSIFHSILHFILHPQFDTLLGELTVREMLMYTAELKRPSEESLASKRAAVDRLLSKLALDACR